ncbi:hypothetical protein ACOMHN_061722 [Nucella lapillus]
MEKQACMSRWVESKDGDHPASPAMDPCPIAGIVIFIEIRHRLGYTAVDQPGVGSFPEQLLRLKRAGDNVLLMQGPDVTKQPSPRFRHHTRL